MCVMLHRARGDAADGPMECWLRISTYSDGRERCLQPMQCPLLPLQAIKQEERKRASEAAKEAFEKKATSWSHPFLMYAHPLGPPAAVGCRPAPHTNATGAASLLSSLTAPLLQPCPPPQKEADRQLVPPEHRPEGSAPPVMVHLAPLLWQTLSTDLPLCLHAHPADPMSAYIYI